MGATMSYNKPFIMDTGRERSLHFDVFAVQSAMDLDDPYRLSLPYTRKMMAFLLFNGAPRRILLLGLGGGSLAKFCYRHLASAAITVVEVNPEVIAFRDAFFIPAQACPNVFRTESAGCRFELILRAPEYAKVLYPWGFSRTG